VQKLTEMKGVENSTIRVIDIIPLSKHAYNHHAEENKEMEDLSNSAV
jgi:hypothetical protein